MTDTRNQDKTFAAGDCLAYAAPVSTAGPSGPNSVSQLAAPYVCLGWLDTSGYIFQLANTYKDIMAAGSLEPIRSVLTQSVKTLQATYLEAANPWVRALYDDVDPSLLQPGAGTSIASFLGPEQPTDNRYVMVFDTFDGDKEVRIFAPNCKITARGNDQPQQSDNESLQMTATFYSALIGGTRASYQRWINYGAADLTPFYSS